MRLVLGYDQLPGSTKLAKKYRSRSSSVAEVLFCEHDNVVFNRSVATRDDIIMEKDKAYLVVEIDNWEVKKNKTKHTKIHVLET